MLRSRRLPAVAALAALAAAALPAGAPAAIPDPPKRVAYDIVIAGLGSYTVHDRFGTDDDPSATTNDLRFDFSYTSTYQDVVFAHGRLESVRIAPEQDGAISVYEGKIEHRNNQGVITDTLTCKANPRLDLQGDGMLEPDEIVGLGSERLMFRPAPTVAAVTDCDDADPAKDHEASHLTVDLARWGWSSTGEAEVGEGPLDINFDLPFEALGMDFIEHPVNPAPEQLEGPHCPGWTIGTTRTCKLEWTGTVRLTKTDLPGSDKGGGGTASPGGPITQDFPLPPMPGSKPAPSPQPKPAPQAGKAPQVGAARLARDRRHVAFTVSCPGTAPCAGTAKASGTKAKRFTVAAGQTKTITIALARRPRRGTATAVAVSVAPKGGAPVRRSLKVRA